MKNTITEEALTGEELVKVANDILNSTLIGGGGAGLLGALGGGLMTKRRKNEYGEEEDDASYRKRVMRNASMMGGLGAVGGAAAGGAGSALMKYFGGSAGPDGAIPDQGSVGGNLAESILGHAGTGLGTGLLANLGLRGRLNSNSAMIDSIKGMEGKGFLETLSKKFPSMHGLRDGTVTDSKGFSNSLRKLWNNNDTMRARLINDKSFSPEILKNLGLSNPKSSVSGGIMGAVNKVLGRDAGSGLRNGSAFSNAKLRGADRFLAKFPGTGTSNALWGKGRGKGKVGALTALAALVPSLAGTFVDDYNH